MPSMMFNLILFDIIIVVGSNIRAGKEWAQVVS